MKATTFITRISLLLIGIGSIILIIYNESQSSPRSLSAYVPPSAIFAVQIFEHQVEQPIHGLLEDHAVLKPLHDSMVSTWRTLEKKLSADIGSAVWSVTESDGNFQTSIIFLYKRRMPRRNTKALEGKLFSDLGWFEQEQLRFTTLDSGVYVLSSLQKEQFHRDAPLFTREQNRIALFVTRKFVEYIQDTPFVTNSVELLQQLVLSQNSVRLYLDAPEGILRILAMQDHRGQEGIRTTLPALNIPESFEVVASGKDVFNIPTEKIDSSLKKYLNQMLTALSNTYNVPRDLTERYVSDATILIIDNNSWLIGGANDQSMGALAEKLAASFHVTVQESVLPDGSPFRELVKQETRPTSTTIGGATVEVWYHPIRDAIYRGHIDGSTFVTNSEALVRIQGEGQPAQKLTDHPSVKKCLAGYEQGTIEALLLIQSSDTFRISEKVQSATLVTFNTQQGQQIVATCLE